MTEMLDRSVSFEQGADAFAAPLVDVVPTESTVTLEPVSPRIDTLADKGVILPPAQSPLEYQAGQAALSSLVSDGYIYNRRDRTTVTMDHDSRSALRANVGFLIVAFGADKLA